MGLILNNKIKALMKGYPTISDKYDVHGGVVATGNDDVAFGAPLYFTATAGAYKTKAAPVKGTDVFAGIAMGTNVKLVTVYPGDTVQAVYKAGEALNVLFRGGVAVETDASLTIKEGEPVYISVASGKFTNTSNSNANIAVDAVFTGIAEGTIAEIVLK